MKHKGRKVHVEHFPSHAYSTYTRESALHIRLVKSTGVNIGIWPNQSYAYGAKADRVSFPTVVDTFCESEI